MGMSKLIILIMDNLPPNIISDVNYAKRPQPFQIYEPSHLLFLPLLLILVAVAGNPPAPLLLRLRYFSPIWIELRFVRRCSMPSTRLLYQVTDLDHMFVLLLLLFFSPLFLVAGS